MRHTANHLCALRCASTTIIVRGDQVSVVAHLLCHQPLFSSKILRFAGLDDTMAATQTPLTPLAIVRRLLKWWREAPQWLEDATEKHAEAIKQLQKEEGQARKQCNFFSMHAASSLVAWNVQRGFAVLVGVISAALAMNATTRFMHFGCQNA